MHVAPLTWVVTLVVAVAVLAVDLAVVGRRPHVPTAAECLRYLAVYVGLAVLFGLGLWAWAGPTYAGQFYAGWLTEYSLSVDNLFVFLLIMGRFAVPRSYQQTALLVGIVLALVLRGVFIVAGTAVINAFSWTFYLFGAFLVWTAWKVGREGDTGDEEYHEPRFVRWIERIVPSTREYHGVRLTVRQAGRRLVTPMLFVLVALGVTDVLFAFDSIPAIFGLTTEPYLVLMANVFALMGLRQLYFLLGDVLRRLVYLHIGLAVLLAFIGVKLVLEALRSNELPFLNAGQPLTGIPELPVWASLLAIVVILGVTALASVLKVRRDARSGVGPHDPRVVSAGDDDGP